MDDCCSGGGLIAYSEANGTNGVVETGIRKKKVVLLGTGWAGTSFLKNLNNSQYEVQIISPRNYFAFTPLLPSVTCGTVEARSVVEPIRNIGRKVIVKSPFPSLLATVLLQWTISIFGCSLCIVDHQYFVMKVC